jgi:chromate transporter
MIYLQLIWSFFQIGLFSIGGGYASISLLRQQVVQTHGWLTMQEFTDIITISQMTPGPIAINSATFVGIRIAGIGGAVAATIGCILPSLMIVLTLAYLYYKYKQLSLVQGVLSGLRPAVVGLIASAGMALFMLAIWGKEVISFNQIKDLDWISAFIFLGALFALIKYRLNPIHVMLGSGAVGLVLYYLF